MNTHLPLRRGALAVAMSLGLALSAAASAEEFQFESHLLSDTLVIEPMDRAALDSSMDLIIKGPNDYISRTRFGAGQPIEFGLRGLVDGTYRYELQITRAPGPAAVRGGATKIEGATVTGASGVFTLVGGNAADSELTESFTAAPSPKTGESTNSETILNDGDGGATRMQVINQDLIVIGSQCVGQDCTSGESFGFDTIRVKENNTRIKFDDTSTSASFPNVDWQLTANESDNGGANKFSIEDVTNGRIPFTLEASAPSNSLFIDDGGRMGLGTSTPVVEMHMVNGDSPTVRLDQNGSSGFTPQVWDMAGNETNFFVRDVTNGSLLPFKIRPGADTNSLVLHDGNVGIGTLNPSQSLDIESNGPVGLDLTNTNAGKTWRFRAGNAGNFVLAEASTPGTDEFVLDEDGNLTIRGEITTASGTSPFPDYVFLDSYKLMPMEELASFIEDNGHLPGFPSAAEVAEKGQINLTEMNKLLLEKIEELTLYTLEQQEAIAELRSKIESN